MRNEEGGGRRGQGGVKIVEGKWKREKEREE